MDDAEFMWMKKKDTHIKILDITYKIFARLGYERTSMTLIAEELGFSKPALYTYYNSKEAIFEMLYSVIIEEIIASYKVTKKVMDQEMYEDYLIHVGNDSIDALKENPEFSSIMMQFFLLGLRNKKIGALTKRLEKETWNYFDQLVNLGIKCGGIKLLDREVFVEMIVIMDQGLLEKSPYKSRESLKEIWSKFIMKILA